MALLLTLRALFPQRHENVENVLVQQIGNFLRLLRSNSAQKIKDHGSILEKQSARGQIGNHCDPYLRLG